MDADRSEGYTNRAVDAMTRNLDQLLTGLNAPQREAVLHAEGPLLVLAGPGSGKTRVITRRAAYLASTVTSPRHVLAITFTNKAAREMRDRVDLLDVEPGITVCTFHSLCARLLRENHQDAGIVRNFTIFDRDDRRKVLKMAIERCGFSETNWTPATVEPIISRAKNALQSAEEFAALNQDWSLRNVAAIYSAYEQLLVEMGGLDFDDLLLRVPVLLETNEPLRDRLESRFRFVLVDEYQDTNAAQYRIARLLTRDRENLCATGDPDQSIYGWRGADIGNILAFERDYPSTKLVRLEQNYRSTGRILQAADCLIAGNQRRKAKSLWTENEPGPAVRIFELESNEDEARAVAEDIAAATRAGVAPGDIAVFYRVNSLSRSLEEAFFRTGIAYQVARGVEFYNRKEIKDVLAYLRVLVNPADEVSLARIINTPPRGIGDTTVERLQTLSQSRQGRLYDALFDRDGLAALGRSAAKVSTFGELLCGLKPALDLPAPQAIEHVVNHSGLRALYAAQKDPLETPLANVDELISAAKEFHDEQPESTVVDWLEHTALLSDVDSLQDESGAVTLMTLHAAKGLEFDCVYIIGLEMGLLPFARPDQPAADEEEERRLCFVGMTRARKRLTMSRARYRTIRGSTQRTARSRFLDELPADGIEWIEVDGRRSVRSAATSPRRSPIEFLDWEIGTLVRHPQYGIGRIARMIGGGRSLRVYVRFPDGSEHTWLPEYSELQRVPFDEVE
jgi:DNA helicase-2/ATP-dependent DNA helicase PcrA